MGTIESGNGCQLIETDTAFPKLGLDAGAETMDVQPIAEDTPTADMATDNTENTEPPIEGDTTTDSDTIDQTDTLEPDDIVPIDDSTDDVELDISTDSTSTDEVSG